MLIAAIAALVLMNLALLAVLAYMVSRRKDPDVEVVRQMLNTAMDAFWHGMSVPKPVAEDAVAQIPPQMEKPLRNDISYDPEEELRDMRPDDGDDINTPVPVTEAPLQK